MNEVMNERIKELALQAGATLSEGFYQNVVGITMTPKELEKFAELIVGECVNMIEAAAENADDEDVHGMRNAAGLISRAFITFYDADVEK